MPSVKENVVAVFEDSSILAKRSVRNNSLLVLLGIQQLPPLHAACIITKWMKPRRNFVKLNSDGCSKENPGLSGGGVLLRNDEGVVL